MAPPIQRVLSDDALAALRADHQRLALQLETLQRRLAAMRCELQNDAGFYLCKLSATVDARSGTTPGSGTGTICQYDGSAIAERGETVTVKNPFASASGSNGAYVLVAIDFYGTVWIVSEDCP